MGDSSSDKTPAIWRLSVSRMMVYLAFGAALGIVHRVTAHPMSAFLFCGYLVGLLVLTLYRQLARLPLLRRYLRPTRLTREGVYFLILTLVFGAAAINTGDNLLHLLLSVLLSLILASGLLAELGLSRLAARRIPRGLYFEGVAGEVALELTNRKLLAPSMSIVVEDQAAGERGRAFFLSIPARSARLQTYPLTPERRGLLELTSLRLSSRFPFGFFEKDRTLKTRDSLLVYPRISPLTREWQAGWGSEMETAPNVPLARDSGEEYLGLREYRPGDNPKNIHWRVTARLQKMMVREFLPPDGRQVVLLLDSYLPAEADDDARQALDACCRIAASLGYQFYLKGFHLTLILPGQPPLVCHQRIGSERFDRLLERLAREQNQQITLGEHLQQHRLPRGYIIPILPGSQSAVRAIGSIPRRRRAEPIFADQETLLLDTSQALIPGEPQPLAMPSTPALREAS